MDKILHFSVSALLYLIFVGLLTVTNLNVSLLFTIIVSSSAAFTIGSVKELYDATGTPPRGHASWGDIGFNVIGILIGVVLHLMIT